jgi:hypothetical protein
VERFAAPAELRRVVFLVVGRFFFAGFFLSRKPNISPTGFTM